MVFGLFRSRANEESIARLYAAIVAQARRFEFYTRFGVPDTLDGRFDMLVLHLALLKRRLAAAGPSGAQASQALFDTFCRDLDHNLREMGVGDLSVPRRMRSFGEAYYGRASAYDRALDANDPALLTQALGRNVYSGHAENERQADSLAAYAVATERELKRQNQAGIVQGAIEFPNPAAFVSAEALADKVSE